MTAGTFDVNSAVTANGSGNVDLDGKTVLTINAPVTTGSGNITLDSDSIVHTAAGDLTTGGAGTITASATNGNLTMADGTVYTAGGGTVSLSGNNVALGQIVNPTGLVNVTAITGNISDNTAAEGAGNENISATTATLVAATGIGAVGCTKRYRYRGHRA